MFITFLIQTTNANGCTFTCALNYSCVYLCTAQWAYKIIIYVLILICTMVNCSVNLWENNSKYSWHDQKPCFVVGLPSHPIFLYFSKLWWKLTGDETVGLMNFKKVCKLQRRCKELLPLLESLLVCEYRVKSCMDWTGQKAAWSSSSH